MSLMCYFFGYCAYKRQGGGNGSKIKINFGQFKKTTGSVAIFSHQKPSLHWLQITSNCSQCSLSYIEILYRVLSTLLGFITGKYALYMNFQSGFFSFVEGGQLLLNPARRNYSLLQNSSCKFPFQSLGENLL